MPLGEALHETGDADLVDHLRELTGTRAAEEVAGTAVGVDHRGDPIEISLVAATHHREHTVLGAGLSARDRGIDETDTLRGGRCVDIAGDDRRRGRVVDKHRSLPHRLEDAVGARGHGEYVGIITDAQEDVLGSLSRSSRSHRHCPTVLRNPSISFRRRSVVHGDGVARSHKMSGHGVPHDTESEKCAGGHVMTLSRDEGNRRVPTPASDGHDLLPTPDYRARRGRTCSIDRLV